MDRPILTQIAVRSFGVIASADVDLSEGATLFVGPNGSGKSTLAEAVSWALYNMLIRSPRRLVDFNPVTDASSVRLTFSDGTEIHRTARKGLVLNGHTGTRDNNAAIVTRFGTHRAFLATRVFHRALLVKFAAGSDLDRRLILEELLGIDAFNDAHKSVRTDIAVADDRFRVSESEYIKASSEYRAVLRLKKRLSPPGPSPESEVLRLTKLMNDKRVVWGETAHPLVKLTEKIADLSSGYQEASGTLAVTRKELSLERRSFDEAKRLLASGECPVCGRALGKGHETKVDERFAQSRRRLKKLEDRIASVQSSMLARHTKLISAKEQRSKIQVAVDEAMAEVDRVQGELSEARGRLRLWEERSAEYKSQRKLDRKELASAKERFSKAVISRTVRSVEVRRLRALSSIFGPRGARVYLLARAFKRLAKRASRIASSIYGKPVAIEILGDHAKGEVLMAIAISGTAFSSYRALSEGEKGVLDFAVLRAIGDITQIGASSPAPLVFDDILDALDDGVSSRVAGYIMRDARQALVLSHSEGVCDLFDGAKSYYVEGGVFNLRG